MTPFIRSTIRLDEKLRQALRRKASETGRTLSDLVNDAVRLSLAEDAEDLHAFQARSAEPTLTMGALVQNLRRRRKL